MFSACSLHLHHRTTHEKVLKLCDGAITHVSTVSGAIWAAGGEDATSTTGAADLGSAGEGAGGGTKTYVVVASGDGAVRFYDLKFRVEVSVVRCIHYFLIDKILRSANCFACWSTLTAELRAGRKICYKLVCAVMFGPRT